MTVGTNPFLVSETLVAERLIEAFDNEDPRFGEYFEAADRVTLGALVAYASLAIRELSVSEQKPRSAVRRRLRVQVATAAAYVQANGELA